MRLQQDEQTSRLPTANCPQPDETRKQKCSTAFQTTPRPVAKRRPLAPCYPASGAGGHRAGSWTVAADARSAWRSAMRHRAQTARTAHSGRRAIARRREKKRIPLLYRWYARTQPTLHSHHPHVKLEISFKASHARNATPIRKLATGPRLVLASLAPPTWLVPRAREGARVARRDQPYTARLRPRRPR